MSATPSILAHSGNSIYARKTAAPFNEALVPGTPLTVYRPRNARGAAEVIRRCRKAARTVSVRATGHDFEGRSLAGQAIIDVSMMRGVRYDPKTGLVRVEGGARVRDLHHVLARHGMALAVGTNEDVGVAGLALGGGAGYASRLRGLTCDALVSVELCAFNSVQLHVDDRSDPTLMRLLRGAGGGWFGVVSALTFRTFPAHPVTRFSCSWEIAEGAALLSTLEALMISAPDDLSMRIGARVSGPERVRRIEISGHLQSADTARLRRHLGSITNARAWREETVSWFAAMQGAAQATTGGAFMIKSRFAQRAIGEDGLARMTGLLGKWTPSLNQDGAGFCLFPWGGVIRQANALHSCAGGRDAEHLVSFDVAWTERDTPATVESQRSWLERIDAEAAPFLSNEGYVNFPDSSGLGFTERHLQRFAGDLAAMRARLDPDGLSMQRPLPMIFSSERSRLHDAYSL